MVYSCFCLMQMCLAVMVTVLYRLTTDFSMAAFLLTK